MLNEIDLIIYAQKGDKKSFQKLITLYYPYVSKFLLNLTLDKLLAEDLTQETFLKIVKNIEKFDIKGKAKFSTYIITIARNTFIDYRRKNRLINVDIYEQVAADSENIEERVLKILEAEEILKQIKGLPAEQGMAIRMKHLEKLTLEEIAKHFKCEPKTIKSRIHNGLKKIRANIEMR